MKTEEFENKLIRIQNIVSWQEEKRVGYSECRNLGKLPTTTLSDIDNKSKKLPKTKTAKAVRRHFCCWWISR